ncbi:MAG: hypothetical protein AB7G24_00895 [Novosphingobium sp.]
MEGEFLEFARAAQPGDRRVYARGEHPPREAVRAMAPLVAAGVLAPISKREAGGFLFMVERGRAPLGSMRPPRRGTVRRRRVRKTSLAMVFDLLVRAAQRGEACPTNEEIAAQCRLSGKLSASYRMRRLVQAGRIAVEDHSPFGRRVVTILTGPQAGRRTVEAAL